MPTTRSAHPDIPPARHMTPFHRSHPTASDARATCRPSHAEKARWWMQQIRGSLGLKLCLRRTRLGGRLQHAHHALCTPRHTPSSTHDATSPVLPNSIRCTSDVLPVSSLEGSMEEATDSNKLPWPEALSALHQALCTLQAAAARPPRAVHAQTYPQLDT